MRFPEHIADHLKSNDGRVKVDLDCFGVVTHVAIGGVGSGATCVANTCSKDSLDSPKLGVGPPESAERKGRGLQIRGNGQVDGWNDTVRRLQVGLRFILENHLFFLLVL